MIFNSIRWRLQAWHGLILVVVLTGFGFTAYHVARDNQRRRIDRELEDRLMALSRPEPPDHGPRDKPREFRWDREGHRQDSANFRTHIRESLQRTIASEASQTNGIYVMVWQEDGTVAARSAGGPESVPMPERVGPPPGTDPGREAPRPDPGPHSFSGGRTRGELRELWHWLPFGDCILVGRSLAPDLAAMQRLAFSLVAAGVSVMLLGLAGGWWLATRAIRPIEDISATAVKIAGGDLSQRISADDTDSELGRLTAVLNSTFARLEAAFAHQVRFTADASHELRTPVSVILTQTQTALARERSAGEYRETLGACQRAAQRMRRLTESLLQLARLDAGEEPMKREPIDLARVARECVELVRPLAAERKVEIRCDLPPVQCLGDAERLGQVATNLLSNAIHFNREGGEVRISAGTENGAVRLTVTDTGKGIPPEDLPHIFERFYRVDKARSGFQGGTGLGLAISKAIVDAHSGTIEASSQPTAGSTFIVSLPAK